MPAIAAIIPALTALSALTSLAGTAKKTTDQTQDTMGNCASSASASADQAGNTLMDSGTLQLKRLIEAMSAKAGGAQQNGGVPSFGGMRA